MELKRSLHYDGIESNFGRDIKSLFRVVGTLLLSKRLYCCSRKCLKRIFLRSLWLAVEKFSFLRNVVEESRPCCGNLEVPNNSKFIWNIPGWNAIKIQVQASDLKSSLVCWFKSMGWSRIFLIDMGQGSRYWLNVAKSIE